MVRALHRGDLFQSHPKAVFRHRILSGDPSHTNFVSSEWHGVCWKVKVFTGVFGEVASPSGGLRKRRHQGRKFSVACEQRLM
mmetsp:Transcript_31571/g.84350  ORF Transcript_31571/g.84350 Transcript_31571/m.84350 type:complete len:82 (+) Transcript_31571:2001-2246(+)